MEFIKCLASWFQIRKTLHLQLKISLSRGSNLIEIVQQTVGMRNFAIHFSYNLQGRNFSKSCKEWTKLIFSPPFLARSTSRRSLLNSILPPFATPGKFHFTTFLGYILPPFSSPRSLYFRALGKLSNDDSDAKNELDLYNTLIRPRTC